MPPLRSELRRLLTSLLCCSNGQHCIPCRESKCKCRGWCSLLLVFVRSAQAAAPLFHWQKVPLQQTCNLSPDDYDLLVVDSSSFSFTYYCRSLSHCCSPRDHPRQAVAIPGSLAVFLSVENCCKSLQTTSLPHCKQCCSAAALLSTANSDATLSTNANSTALLQLSSTLPTVL